MRNAVVASPERTTGCATSQRRKARLVSTPYDLGLVECGGEQLERLRAIATLGDDLGDHRVVRDPDLVTLLDSRVDAHPGRQVTSCHLAA